MLTRGTLIYIAQRLALIVFTLVAVSFMVFVTVHSLPGNAFESERVHGAALNYSCTSTARPSDSRAVLEFPHQRNSR